MSKKFNASSVVILLAALCSCAAAIVFQSVNGVFGQMKYDYYNAAIVVALIGSAVAAIALMACRLHGLASAVVTAAPLLSLCAFFLGKNCPLFTKRAAYWHIADVFMKIDEPTGFDPKFLLFVGLMAAAFIIGEVAIYLRKPGQAKA